MPKRLTIAFQGEHGAFSEEAASAYCASLNHTPVAVSRPYASFTKVFDAVQKKEVNAGIIPIENSLFGSVHENYDLLDRYPLNIIGEVKLRVNHMLMAIPGVKLGDIRHVYSHPQALGQCDQYLQTLHNVEIVAVYDTAGSAKMISEQRMRSSAAIASVVAARLYGLHILKRGIESNHHNYTRFLVLSRRPVPAKNNAKTSIIFSLKSIPGALFKALSVFALRNIDLEKIESRPIMGKPWEYLFYLDFSGSIADKNCRHALEALGDVTSHLRILGSYTKV
ncbi:MAG: prephenate dehydratase [Bacteroidota bacterium]